MGEVLGCITYHLTKRFIKLKTRWLYAYAWKRLDTSDRRRFYACLEKGTAEYMRFPFHYFPVPSKFPRSLDCPLNYHHGPRRDCYACMSQSEIPLYPIYPTSRIRYASSQPFSELDKQALAPRKDHAVPILQDPLDPDFAPLRLLDPAST